VTHIRYMLLYIPNRRHVKNTRVKILNKCLTYLFSFFSRSSGRGARSLGREIRAAAFPRVGKIFVLNPAVKLFRLKSASPYAHYAWDILLRETFHSLRDAAGSPRSATRNRLFSISSLASLPYFLTPSPDNSPAASSLP